MNQMDHHRLAARIAVMLATAAGGGAAAEAQQILDGALEQEGGGEELALAWAQRRAQGAPLGLVIGQQPFLGVHLKARDHVLVAREETELLGREVLAVLQELAAARPEGDLRLIDMGCGSGNLACALAVAVPRARVWASDLTQACVDLTLENVALHSLQGRVQVTRGDLFAPLRGQGLEGSMDVIAMNPPYIPSAFLRKAHAPLLDHEPQEAFDGGPYGISIVSRLLQEAPDFLTPKGHLLFEFGLGQGRMIHQMVERKRLFTGMSLVANARGEARVARLWR